ncbi:MAG TPA: MGMT family protein [Caldilineaceae bacterium]|nr:MGMT family protein [Caldilineaceae bacterium]
MTPTSEAPLQHEPTYERIYLVVRAIPAGRVATYGQIAAIVGDCTARMVGYAMAALPPGSGVPWHRVINAQGKISLRGDGGGAIEQRKRLEAEGVHFDREGRVNLRRFQWPGPTLEWLLEHGFAPGPLWRQD